MEEGPEGAIAAAVVVAVELRLVHVDRHGLLGGEFRFRVGRLGDVWLMQGFAVAEENAWPANPESSTADDDRTDSGHQSSSAEIVNTTDSKLSKTSLLFSD